MLHVQFVYTTPQLIAGKEKVMVVREFSAFFDEA
jgi:hypothetical protein